jgi:hypothetical protein
MGPMVEQVFPYGESEDTLGASPGGRSRSAPSTGASAGWHLVVLDAANLRLAHFEDGVYLDQVECRRTSSSTVQYFQWQMPQAMDDGSIVASGLRSEPTRRCSNSSTTV